MGTYCWDTQASRFWIYHHSSPPPLLWAPTWSHLKISLYAFDTLWACGSNSLAWEQRDSQSCVHYLYKTHIPLLLLSIKVPFQPHQSFDHLLNIGEMRWNLPDPWLLFPLLGIPFLPLSQKKAFVPSIPCSLLCEAWLHHFCCVPIPAGQKSVHKFFSSVRQWIPQKRNLIINHSPHIALYYLALILLQFEKWMNSAPILSCFFLNALYVEDFIMKLFYNSPKILGKLRGSNFLIPVH